MMVTVPKVMILSLFQSLNIGYMDQLNTTPFLQCTNYSLSILCRIFLTLSQWLTGNFPLRFKRTLRSGWNLCIRSQGFICAFSPVFLSSSCWLILRYEWFISLDFEWDFISGKKRLRWPMVSTATLLHWMQWHQNTDILFCEPIFPALCDHWNVGESTFWRRMSLINHGSIVSLDKVEYACTIRIPLIFLIAPWTWRELDCQALYTFLQVSPVILGFERVADENSN